MVSPRVAALGLALLLGVSLACAEGIGKTHSAFDEKVRRFARAAPSNLRASPVLSSSSSSTSQMPLRSRTLSTANTDEGLRVVPTQFGGDPTGRKDSTAAIQAAVNVCLNQSAASPNGMFPGWQSFGNGKAIGDMGGCFVDLDGGEYLISSPIVLPEYNANMNFGFGSLVASSTFPKDGFLFVIGIEGSCKVPQGSCNLDINFPNLFMDGSNVASGCMQINNVMGVTVGPGGYFLNFTNYGIQINNGHEVMVDRCWLGETNFDYNFQAMGVLPTATAIQINGNDHYILNTIIFSSKIGLEVNGAADYIQGVHVWFPYNQALFYNFTRAFSITSSGNRFSGCYIDGGRAVFEGDGANGNMWTNGFDCCAGGGLQNVPHGILIKSDTIGPGLVIMNNEFGSGNIWYMGSAQNPTVVGTVIDNNYIAKSSRATKTLTGTNMSTWTFDFCSDLVFKTIASVQFSVTAASGFPQAVARPTTNCTLTIETSEPMTGSITASVDSSTY